MEVLFGLIFITFDYGNTVNWQVIEGRDFSRELRTDSVSNRTTPSNIPTSVIVNEAAVKHMNLTNPVGEIFKYGDHPIEIIGVIKDMIIESPYEPIRPMVYVVNYPQAINFTYIKLNPNISLKQALPQMETVFKKHVPAVPFDYEFADEAYGEKFESEVRLGKLAGVFAVLAILISCLGLQGLASFMAEQRTKEIGIRKVLGASVANLWQMLSQEFIVLVIISFLISAPIAYYFMDKWLQDYMYRTGLSWWIFACAGAGAIIITYLTVSFQAVKAALTNPVESLRSE
jgi:ABC-type antimicrobial peptide transport system permease subunit